MTGADPDAEKRRVAHDLNNLLATILNYAELLLDELPAGQLRNDVVEIQDAATKAAEITRRMLAGGASAHEAL